MLFFTPGAHLIIKWNKRLQDNKSRHVVQIPYIPNLYVCPVTALNSLLRSSAPLFVTNIPHARVIDIHIRQALKSILATRNISHAGHGFHTFRCSGATWHLTTVSQNIMSHGLWSNSAMWTYYRMRYTPQSIFQLPFNPSFLY